MKKSAQCDVFGFFIANQFLSFLNGNTILDFSEKPSILEDVVFDHEKFALSNFGLDLLV